MSALDELQKKGEYTELESVIVTYAFHERRARGDDKNPASIKAAAELAAKDAETAALRERVSVLEEADENFSLLFISGFSVNLRVVKGGDVVAECHDYSDPLEHRKTYGRGANWKEAIASAVRGEA